MRASRPVSEGKKGELADQIRGKKAALAVPVPGPTPTTQAEVLALSHDELQAACVAEGLSDAGTDSELQSRLNARLFKDTDSRTPEQKVKDSCDAEMGALLLKVVPGQGRRCTARWGVGLARCMLTLARRSRQKRCAGAR